MSSSVTLGAHPGGDRPSKRQRTDEDAPSQPSEVRIARSDVVWKPDGDLVIRTVSQSPDEPFVTHTLYRAHKVILATHCAVFASMFEGDQTAFEVASERYEGAPVMELPDAAEDVENFLDAMYHPKQLRKHMKERGQNPLLKACMPVFPDSYFGVLRLSTKYDAHDMREQVATALARMWPDNLDDWDSAESMLPDITDDYREPGKYIRLATASDLPELLPAMFYDLARASDITLSDMEICRGMLERYEADLALLTRSELRRLINGKTTLRAFVTGRARWYWGSLGPACEGRCGRSPGCLTAAKSQWRESVTMVYVQDGDYLDYLGYLERTVGDFMGDPVCDRRKQHVKSEIRRIREDTWDALREVFGIVIENRASAASV
ncbi:hypothetical protein FA95DRAFT_1565078 [Auriscalpium vulgare]|uniref:Uncharacterized protein n=1 Tax=Auriscalpium vulgare TaxID=40419 RepID=A0ACB8RDL9_9AGAM|nr:hypothetical protein FA95DRAFT_1565078 [Auriscalpium vulgare]